jgi:uncharacterized protein (TIGR02145 family)
MSRLTKYIFILSTFYFLLSTNTFAQASTSSLAKMRIAGKPQKSATEFVSRRDANGKICAAIQVISDMDGFKYQSNNGIVGNVDDQPGRDMVYLSPDERVLEIFKTGYEPLKIILSEYGIQLREKEVWQIKIKGDAKTGDLLPVTIMVQPPDAAITIDGQQAQSDQPVKLSKGPHQLRIEKQGFQPVEETITVSEKEVLFRLTLKEVDIEPVQFRSTPDQARILLNGVEQGLTNKGLFLFPGKYAIKLIKSGYVEVEESINVLSGGQNNFTYTLIKNSSSLRLQVTPADATVLLNKQNYSPSAGSGGQKQIELAPGMYKLEIAKEGYYPQSETFEVKRGATLQKTYSLTAKTGKLQFTVQPLDAKVILLRNGQTVQTWSGMQYLKDLPVGSYTLKATAPGRAVSEKLVTIGENQTAILDMQLRKQTTNTLSGETGHGATGTMTDIDGNVYKTIKIGNQVWMAENLKVTRYRNGDPIPSVTSKSQWENLRSGAYCAYNNDNGNVATYGLLYNWYAVDDGRNIAPEGWHVPTDEEWKELEMHLGMSRSEADDTGWRGTDEGGKLKEAGTAHWNSPNTGATNSSGFTALPGGFRSRSGAFFNVGYIVYWWSATASIGSTAWSRYLGYDNSAVGRRSSYKRSGFSVRLVRDE